MSTQKRRAGRPRKTTAPRFPRSIPVYASEDLQARVRAACDITEQSASAWMQEAAEEKLAREASG